MSEPLTTIVCHSGKGHADDVCGVAVLSALHPDAKVIRTREQRLIDSADFVVDVGGVWDEPTGRFDHHQRGFSGCRDDKTVYASAGLVWRAHGAAFVKLVAGAVLAEDQCEALAGEIDRDFIIHVDRADTGEAHGAPGLFGFSSLVAQLNPTWLESSDAAPGSALEDQAFFTAVQLTQVLLSRMVKRKAARCAAEQLVRSATTTDDGRILLLERGVPWQAVVVNEMPRVRFVVFPEDTGTNWVVRTVPVAEGSFDSRLDFPAPWAGLRDSELADASGVQGARFVHNNLFIGGATSRQAALNLAQAALGGAHHVG